MSVKRLMFLMGILVIEGAIFTLMRNAPGFTIEKLAEHTGCRYDEKGRMIEESYDDCGGVSGKLLYKYDEKGNQIEVKQYVLQGEAEVLSSETDIQYEYYEKKK